jgi:hypothetical protein
LLSLLGFLYIEHGYLSHPAGVTFVSSDDQAKRPLRGRQNVAIPTVGKDNDPVREVRIELGQREHDSVTVSRVGGDVELHLRSPELLA